MAPGSLHLGDGVVGLWHFEVDLHIYIYIYREREREREYIYIYRERERERERHRDIYLGKNKVTSFIIYPIFLDKVLSKI